jgi:hypothetical protein
MKLWFSSVFFFLKTPNAYFLCVVELSEYAFVSDIRKNDWHIYLQLMEAVRAPMMHRHERYDLNLLCRASK